MTPATPTAPTPATPASPTAPTLPATVAAVRKAMALSWDGATFSDEPPGKLREVTLASADGRRVTLTLRYQAPLLFSDQRAWSPDAVDTATVVATTVVAASGAAATAESEVTLREGEPIEIAPGYRATLLRTAYAHLSGDRNSSDAWLTLEGPDGKVEVALDRMHPGPPTWTKVGGLELALEYADAYGKQGSAGIRVRPAR